MIRLMIGFNNLTGILPGHHSILLVRLVQTPQHISSRVSTPWARSLRISTRHRGQATSLAGISIRESTTPLLAPSRELVSSLNCLRIPIVKAMAGMWSPHSLSAVVVWTVVISLIGCLLRIVIWDHGAMARQNARIVVGKEVDSVSTRILTQDDPYCAYLYSSEGMAKTANASSSVAV